MAKQGAAVRFVCRHFPESLGAEARRRGHHVVAIASRGVQLQANGVPHAHWLGTTQQADAIDTRDLLADRVWDWVVVDHYALDARWEAEIRGSTKHLLVIDDLADRAHDCDLLLDQNHFADGEKRYAGILVDRTEVLLGPRYALLRPEYADSRRLLTRRSEAASRVMVFFGGSDPHGLTLLALEALADPRLSHLRVDVVTGSDSVVRAAVDQHAATRSGITVHGPRPHLADLLSRSDLAIGAGGATTWERMCLGVPSLVVVVAENQMPVSRGLAEAKLVRLVGAIPDVTVDDICRALNEEILRPTSDAVLRMGMQLSDGQGVARVCEAMSRRQGLGR
jgi:UDP-2,4-diacetamido-2,4,6-trideoxy-beta-L-altropyranose hydrolase